VGRARKIAHAAVAALVLLLVAFYAWWAWRLRVGFPLNSDEAKYLAIAAGYGNAWIADGASGLWVGVPDPGPALAAGNAGHGTDSVPR
jgi:hypothetical protein